MYRNLNSPTSNYQMAKRLNHLPGETYANQAHISKHKAHFFLQTWKDGLDLAKNIHR